MSTIEKALLSGLFGKTRKSILALLYTHPDESFYLRQILRLSGVAHGAGQRELKWLTESGIVTRRVSGNQVYYQANRNLPIYPELQSLIIKTAGIGDVLKRALSRLSDRIKFALIFGSAARRETSKRSDIDILVVGEVSFAEIGEMLVPAQEILQREINPSVYPFVEFKKKLEKSHHFLGSVLEGEYILLFGNGDELRRLASKRVAD
ncbi:MAG: nucleotidyltransferase domain-containing protein [Candidatus Aminicenantes bacterium]|nr:nucleotidyltransferase domain-containing protein [Candidatus Aminicenantes bacterium]